jgi:hypothetical protein
MYRAVLLASLIGMFTAGCYGPDREPGDDPSRSDEGPTAGRPESNPSQTVDESGVSGGRTTDAGENVDDGNGTLDGTSDEITAPAQ